MTKAAIQLQSWYQKFEKAIKSLEIMPEDRKYERQKSEKRKETGDGLKKQSLKRAEA